MSSIDLKRHLQYIRILIIPSMYLVGSDWGHNHQIEDVLMDRAGMNCTSNRDTRTSSTSPYPHILRAT
jgi:hypothetical protein